MAERNSTGPVPEDPFMTRIGIIGLSEGNGHPFSFSAIINGYSESGMADSGWAVIHEYLRRRDASEFGFSGCAVTHAWTQDPSVTRRLCKASGIPHGVSTPEEMIGQVDAVIVARDDYQNHLQMALPFLQAGLHVFIDKPLSLDIEELRTYRPYLEAGKLMSCSAMRYARELDEARADLSAYGELRLVRAAILNSWEKYGIHMVDALLNLLPDRPSAVIPLEAEHASMALSMDNGLLVQIDALGDVVPCFRIDLFGTRKNSSHEIKDNFSMFRRMLWHFLHSVENGEPAIESDRTLEAMRVLIAGQIAKRENRKVLLDDVVL
jgi:predicted dehydrogenase